MGKVLLAGEVAQEVAALEGVVVANGATEHRVFGFDGIEHRAQRHFPLHLNLGFTFEVGQVAQMVGKNYSYHRSVCTSTDSTPGRCSAMTCQLSPPSGET